MPFWDWCLESEDEKIEEIFVEDIPVIKVVAQKNYNLRNKGPILDKDDKIPLRKITPPPAAPKSNEPPASKASGKTNKILQTNTNELSTPSSTGNSTRLNAIPNNDKTSEPKTSQTMDNTNPHALDYNVIEDMKKTKANISMFDIYSLSQQHELLNDAFNPNDTQKRMVVVTDNSLSKDGVHEIHKVEIAATINAGSIWAYLKSQVPHFLLTYEIFNFNVHNCLANSGASSNTMPFIVCQKINVVPQMTKNKIIQLEKKDVKVKGELRDVLIRLSYDHRVHQTIDIVVVDIPKSYGLLLSMDWLVKLQG